VQTQTFDPVDAWYPSAAELAPLAGSYASEEVGTTWLLAVEDGKLFIRHRGVHQKPLTATVKDTFTLGDMQLTFQRGPGGAVTGFLVDAGRSRGFTFHRQPAT
jgi:hypothetical protein